MTDAVVYGFSNEDFGGGNGVSGHQAYGLEYSMFLSATHRLF